MDATMHPIAERYIRKSALPLIFCPGCGDGTVLNAFLRAIDELGIMDNLALLGGIGCSSWIPVFVNTDVFHTLHGRAIPVATGLKLSNPKLNVVVFTGDGDCLAIGGNHFMHAARRNIDITVIMLDNQVYGMTGGQLAPTTPTGARTQTSPYGNPEPTMDPCAIAISCGATYVARWTSVHPREMISAIKEGIQHKGFSFLDIISQCPTQAGRYLYRTRDAADLLRLQQTNSVPRSKAGSIPLNELEGKFVVGRLHEDNDRPEFCERLYALMRDSKG